MSRHTLLVTLLGSVFSLAPALADEKKIDISDLPSVVAKAARKAFPTAKVVGASKETDDGETTYEVMMTLDGKSIDLTIDDDGEIEGIEKEIEVEDLPRAVIKAARKAFPDRKIVKVEEVTDEDEAVVYELTFEAKGGKTLEVTMSPSGKVVDDEDDDDDDDDDKKGKDKDEKGKGKGDKKKEDKPRKKDKD